MSKRHICLLTSAAQTVTIAAMRKSSDLAAIIRKAVKDQELSTYVLARDSGVNIAVIVRFLNGTRGITLETASKLCHTLDLTLVSRREK